MKRNEYDERPEYTFVDWYADCHPLNELTIPHSVERNLDRFLESFFQEGGANLSTMQRVRFRSLVWEAVVKLLQEDAVRKDRKLASLRPTIEGIVRSLANLEEQMQRLSGSLRGSPIITGAFRAMCLNEQVPWSEGEIFRYPLLAYAVAFRDGRLFFDSQCPPPDSNRGGRTDLNLEVRFFASITKAFLAVGLPIVIRRRAHDGGSIFVRDRFYRTIGYFAIEYGPTSTRYLARRAKKLGFL